MRRTFALVVLVFLAAAACRPGTTPGTPESVYTWQDGWNAVEQAFADRGPVVLDCAHRIAARESNHNPYARNGKYEGVFQLHPGFDGTIAHLAAVYGFPFASRLDPYLNALAARGAFDYYEDVGRDKPTSLGVAEAGGDEWRSPSGSRSSAQSAWKSSYWRWPLLRSSPRIRRSLGNGETC